MESKAQVQEADAEDGERDVYDSSKCTSSEANLKRCIVIVP
jgi:hypothetical protein